jgi:hypothetical protein
MIIYVNNILNVPVHAVYIKLFFSKIVLKYMFLFYIYQFLNVCVVHSLWFISKP